MKTAEPRNIEEKGWFARKIDPWMQNDEEFVNYGMDELREQYHSVKSRDDGDFSRYLKDAMLHVAALSYDAVLDGELGEGDFENVLESTRGHVVNHYFKEEEPPEPVITDLKRETRQFSIQGTSSRQQVMNELAEAGQDGTLREWYKTQTGQTPDRVIGIPGGGIETGIIAAETLNVDLDLIRCSPRKRDDSKVHAINKTDYEGQNILVVDDIKDKGRAEETTVSYLEEKGAENVLFDTGIPRWSFL